MARYRMSDGTVVDTDKASASWEEGTRWDGNNRVSLTTGSQWFHQRLYRSRRGRYYIESTSNYERQAPSAEWVSNEEATRWLLANEHSPGDDNWPEELTEFVDQVSE